ncbi:hypothetical protein BHM03_00038607 [Ensete ventricosum]|nr:hypothetical protein BHM03_00038607 [Ensete ventricosum]
MTIHLGDLTIGGAKLGWHFTPLPIVALALTLTIGELAEEHEDVLTKMEPLPMEANQTRFPTKDEQLPLETSDSTNLSIEGSNRGFLCSTLIFDQDIISQEARAIVDHVSKGRPKIPRLTFPSVLSNRLGAKHAWKFTETTALETKTAAGALASNTKAAAGPLASNTKGAAGPLASNTKAAAGELASNTKAAAGPLASTPGSAETPHTSTCIWAAVPEPPHHRHRVTLHRRPCRPRDPRRGRVLLHRDEKEEDRRPKRGCGRRGPIHKTVVPGSHRQQPAAPSVHEVIEKSAGINEFSRSEPHPREKELSQRRTVAPY